MVRVPVVVEPDGRSQPLYLRYGIAIIATSLTRIASSSISPYLGSDIRYMPFMLAVVVSAWFGGFGPGILTTFTSAVAVWYAGSEPVNHGRVLVVALFLIQGSIISYIIEVMHHSRRRIAELVSGITDGFITFDRNWKVLYVNEMGAQIAHRRQQDLIGYSVWDVCPEAVGTEFWNRAHEAMRQQRALHFEFQSLMDARWFEYSLYPSMEGLTLYCHDITQRRQDRTELLAAKAEIERMNADLEQRVEERTIQLKATINELEGFSYTISHDLRAPLRAIDGFSKLLSEEYQSKLDAEGQTIIGIIRDSAVRMGNLIEGLLAFSRLGRQVMGSAEINVAELVRGAFSEAGSGETTFRTVNFKVADIPPVIGDPALMRQVFVNLLSNALKFTKGKDPAIIHVGSMPEGGENIFYVKDNGVGFDMQHAGKLFGVFQRFHAVSEFEGTGLGLAIVQRIIQRHGGRVWAESKLGQGTTIFFSLPKIQSKSEEDRHVA